MGNLLNRKTGNEFFTMFVEGGDIANKAAVALSSACQNGCVDFVKLHAVKTIEHEGDLLVHRSLKLIEKAFITPIDRNDILTLLNNIENVTDSIDELSNHFYMMNITKTNSYIDEFMRLLNNATQATKELLEEFTDFQHRRAEINEAVIRINKNEEEGDANYIQAIRSLYASQNDPIDVIRLQTIYDLFEKCIDNTEDVADTIATILISVG